MAFCCDAAFSEVCTKKEPADCMHALIFFNYNIVAKMKMLLFNSLAPSTRLKRPTYDGNWRYVVLSALFPIAFGMVTNNTYVR